MTALAAVSRTDITPYIGAPLYGYQSQGERGAEDIRDRLYATALALSDGGEPFLCLSLDVLVLTLPEADSIRADIESEFGIPRERAMVCTTQTHSGPALTPEYFGKLRKQTVAAARGALRTLGPARVGWGEGYAEAAVDRRDQTAGRPEVVVPSRGATDPSLPVLRIDRPDGAPLAVVYRYSAHPTVLTGDSRVISADWPGEARRVIEEALGCTAFYVEGTAGNQSAAWRGGDDALRRMGGAVGGEVVKVADRIETGALLALKTASKTITMRLQPIPTEEEAQRLAAEAHARWGANGDPWLEQISELRGTLTAPAGLPLELHAVRINDRAVVGMPMEPFVGVAPSPPWTVSGLTAMLCGNTNGWIGYLGTPEEYPAGGYEVEWLPVVYGRYVGLLTPPVPETGAEVIAAATEMIAGLANGT